MSAISCLPELFHIMGNLCWTLSLCGPTLIGVLLLFLTTEMMTSAQSMEALMDMHTLKNSSGLFSAMRVQSSQFEPLSASRQVKGRRSVVDGKPRWLMMSRYRPTDALGRE